MIAFLMFFAWLVLMLLPVGVVLCGFMLIWSSSWGGRNSSAGAIVVLIGSVGCWWWWGVKPFEIVFTGVTG